MKNTESGQKGTFSVLLKYETGLLLKIMSLWSFLRQQTYKNPGLKNLIRTVFYYIKQFDLILDTNNSPKGTRH